MRLNQVMLACLGYDESCRFYEHLGLTRIVDDPPRYARFECPSPDGTDPATLSLHQVSHIAGQEAARIYFEVDDLPGQVTRLAKVGIVTVEGPVHQPWLWFEAWYADPAGNHVCLYEAGRMRRFPPWRLDTPSA